MFGSYGFIDLSFHILTQAEIVITGSCVGIACSVHQLYPHIRFRIHTRPSTLEHTHVRQISNIHPPVRSHIHIRPSDIQFTDCFTDTRGFYNGCRMPGYMMFTFAINPIPICLMLDCNSMHPHETRANVYSTIYNRIDFSTPK